MSESDHIYRGMKTGTEYPKGGVCAERHDITRHTYLAGKMQYRRLEAAERRRAFWRRLRIALITSTAQMFRRRRDARLHPG
jgi:hypothetical protein